MTKDEALDLALEALGMYQAAGFGNSTDFNKQHEAFYKAQTAITAIKQARALDKKAENARELGLDYEPMPENFMDALRFDVAMRDAAPVQEPVGLIARLKNPEDHYEFTDPKKANAVLMSLCQEAADALAAPVPMAHIVGEIDHTGKVWKPVQPADVQPVQEPVAWMYPDDYERMLTSETFCTVYSVEVGSATRGKSTVPLYTTPPAQPAVPDAMTSADIQEHIEYVAGWNDCRQAMLEMMK